MRAIFDYCAANWPSTSLQAGDREAACVARHCTIRPPRGWTPPHSERTSPPQADRSTNSSSRGRIGRSTNTGAGAGAAAGAAAPGLAVAASFGGPPPARAGPPPPAAVKGVLVHRGKFVLFFFTHFHREASPPRPTAQHLF